MSNFKDVTKFTFYCNKILPTVYDDALSYYEVLAKLTNNMDELIDNENTQNEAINALESGKQDVLTAGEGITISENTISVDTSELATKEDLEGKQDTLVSAENIKTINGNNILGSGNVNIETGKTYVAGDGITLNNDAIAVQVDNEYIKINGQNQITAEGLQPKLESTVNIKSINGSSILGDGNLIVTGGTAYSAGTGINIDSSGEISIDSQTVPLKSELAAVATTGAYTDLSGIPGEATTSAAGLMSATDKAKLNGIAQGATANIGTLTGITMNGESVGTTGVVDLGTVLTSTEGLAALATENTFTATQTFNDVTVNGTLNAEVSETEYAEKIGTSASHGAIGTTSQPVYVNASGEVTECSTFAQSAVTSNVLTRTGGVTGSTATSVRIQMYGRVCFLHVTVAGDDSTTVLPGNDYWIGTISSTYRPDADVEAFAYLSNSAWGMRIESNGTVTVRYATGTTASQKIGSGGIHFSFAYFI